jgi:hypothetical protein
MVMAAAAAAAAVHCFKSAMHCMYCLDHCRYCFVHCALCEVGCALHVVRGEEDCAAHALPACCIHVHTFSVHETSFHTHVPVPVPVLAGDWANQVIHPSADITKVGRPVHGHIYVPCVLGDPRLATMFGQHFSAACAAACVIHNTSCWLDIACTAGQYWVTLPQDPSQIAWPACLRSTPQLRATAASLATHLCTFTQCSSLKNKTNHVTILCRCSYCSNPSCISRSNGYNPKQRPKLTNICMSMYNSA